ncbi:hypothetical protein HRbin04_00088 [archaeon HR04]|nr:hypothetical protein HRbin04_00088 [archaeon HR04]
MVRAIDSSISRIQEVIDKLNRLDVPDNYKQATAAFRKSLEHELKGYEHFKRFVVSKDTNELDYFKIEFQLTLDYDKKFLNLLPKNP